MFATWCFSSQRPEVHIIWHKTSWTFSYFGLIFRHLNAKFLEFQCAKIADIFKVIAKKTVIKDEVKIYVHVMGQIGFTNMGKSRRWVWTIYLVKVLIFSMVFVDSSYTKLNLESISIQFATSKNSWIS